MIRPALQLPAPEALHDARERLRGLATRTPLIRLHGVTGEVWLKCENLQPIGSFKIRGAGNAIRRMAPADYADGVATASAGNMAQGVAWCARELGVPCHVIVPDNAPRAKVDAIEALGARVVHRPYEDWWRVLETHDPGDVPGAFVHPVEHNDVMAGNGTIALEILEDLPHVETVIVPYGGGGLIAGIGAGLRALRAGCRVVAAEVSTAAPLRAALDAGGPVPIDHVRSFVDGIGGRSLLPAMWPLVRQVVDDAFVVTPAQVASAMRILVRQARLVAEGAGAASVAAALRASSGPTVCVVSGGNVDPGVLSRILGGETP